MEIDREGTSLEVTYEDVSSLMKEIKKLKQGTELVQEVKRDFDTSQTEQANFYFRPAFMSNRFYHMIKIEESIRSIKAVQNRQSILVEDRLHKLVLDKSEIEKNDHESSQYSSVDELDKAVAHFINVIDRFLHAYDHNRFEYDFIDSIVRTCPKLLTRKNENGELPFHCVIKEVLDIDTSLLTLFASVGSQPQLGPLSTARGGLLLEIPEAVPVKATNVLQTLVELKEIKRLNALVNSQVPLIVKEDVKKYHLLKYAVMDGPFDRMYDATLATVKLIIAMDPSCVYHPDENGNIPIYYSLNDSEMVRSIVQSAMEYDPFHESIGGLFSMHECGNYVIDFILGIKDIDNWYQEPVSETQKMREKRHWDAIESIISPFQTIPILHKTIIHCPHLTPDVLLRFPYSVHLRDEKFRLPIHQALDRGLNWHELAFVLHANSNFIESVDPVKKFPPFALAALGERSCDLRTIYYLLRRNPELLLNERNVGPNHSPKAKKMRKNDL